MEKSSAGLWFPLVLDEMTKGKEAPEGDEKTNSGEELDGGVSAE
jgi:hypothetical protein